MIWAKKTKRLAVFAPHPVQYHVGIYRELARLDDIHTMVFFEDRVGLEPVYVKEFNTTIQWDVDLLEGYPHRFIKNWSRNSEGGFLARVNPGVVPVLLQGGFDAVLLQSYCRLTDWFVFAAAKMTGLPVIFRGEATLRPGLVPSVLRTRLKHRFLARFLNQCEAVLYSCTGNRAYLKSYGVPESRMDLIPCAVDNRFFQEGRVHHLKRTDDIRADLGCRKNDFVIVLAAQMTSRKRPFDLIDAVKRIEHGDIVLLFIGDGPLRQEMERRCSENGIRSIFTGFVNQGELSKYYSIGNLFAMLSEYDASPKAMNEAMNFAMPVICTKVTGTAYDLVEDGVNGFLIDTGDVAVIARHIDFFRKNREIAGRMGQRSLEIVRDWNFEADALAIRRAVMRVCP